MDGSDLTLRAALAADRLEDFVRQEEARGIELGSGSDFERALALFLVQRGLASIGIIGRRFRASLRRLASEILTLLNISYARSRATRSKFRPRMRTMRSRIVRRKHVGLTQAHRAFYDSNTQPRRRNAVAKALRRVDKKRKSCFCRSPENLRKMKPTEHYEGLTA